jgi:curved DNA-binding protein CbpA
MTLYETLGVEVNATFEQIKVNYKKFALRYHPDRNDGSPESNALFQDINEAYRILSDPIKRQEYDNQLEVIPKTYSDRLHSTMAGAVDECLSREMAWTVTQWKHRDKPSLKNMLGLWLLLSIIVWYSASITTQVRSAPMRSATTTTKEKLPDNVYVTISEVQIYPKPNIESNATYSAGAGTEFIVLRTTRYFAYVSFRTDSGVKKGYVLLDKILKK